MPKIIFKGWNYGFHKISTTKLLQEKASMSFRQAKDSVDKILEGEILTIEIDNVTEALDFVEKASALGAICELLEDDGDSHQQLASQTQR